jgi:hypothetical protein
MANAIKNKPLIIFLLHFINNAIGVCTLSYSNALFLSSYSSKWVPYLLIGQSTMDMVAVFLLLPFLDKKGISGFVTVLLAAISTIIIFTYILPLGFYLAPLIFSLLLVTIGLLCNVIIWNYTRAILNMIEFKKLGNLIIIASALGNITVGIGVSLILNYIPLNIILFVTIVFIIMQAIIILRFNPLQINLEKLTHGVRAINYPIFHKILMSVAIVVTCCTLTDYCLKVKLGTTFNSRDIAQFMGIFIALSSSVTLILGLLVAKPILHKYGVLSLLSALPMYWLISSFGVVFFPSLWMIGFMAAGRYIFYANVFGLGREWLLNVLPFQLRVAAQFQLKAIVSPIAGGLAAIVLILIGRYLTLSEVAILISLLSLFLIYYIKNMQATYIDALKEAIYLKRFISEANGPHIEVDNRIIQGPSISLELAHKLFADLKQQKFFYSARYVAHKLSDAVIPLLVQHIENSTDKHQALLIKILVATPAKKEMLELALTKLISKSSFLTQFEIAKNVAYQIRKIKPGDGMQQLASNRLHYLHHYILLLNGLKDQYQNNKFVFQEIVARIWFAKEQLLYWLVIYTNSPDIINLLPILLKDSQQNQAKAKAIELIDAVVHEYQLVELMSEVLLTETKAHAGLQDQINDYLDSWLKKIIVQPILLAEEKMDDIQKVAILRQTSLFKYLPGEVLLSIAEEAKEEKKICCASNFCAR